MTSSRNNAQALDRKYADRSPSLPHARYILLRSISLALNIAIILVSVTIALMVNFVLASFSRRALPSGILALHIAVGVEATLLIFRVIADIRRAYSAKPYWPLRFLSDILSRILPDDRR